MFTEILALSLLSAAPQIEAVSDDIAGDRLYEMRRTPIVRVAQNSAPAVVFIQTDGVRSEQNMWGFTRQRRVSGSGSGVVILPEGFIVTNYHVVRNANSRITVSFNPQYDDRVYPAQLVSFVKDEDLALLKIPHERDFPTIPLGTSSDLMPGETVVAIGNPHGQTHSVSQGIISGLHRNIKIPLDTDTTLHFDDLIQTDASINLGNSGGPLLNIHGDLIGITTLVKAEAENMGYAIPVDRVRSVLANRLFSPEWERTWLGFDLRPEGPEGAGTAGDLLVGTVVPGGPADLAGLPSGARLVAMDGRGECERAPVLGAREWIEGNQVHLAGAATHQPRQVPGVRRAVVRRSGRCPRWRPAGGSPRPRPPP